MIQSNGKRRDAKKDANRILSFQIARRKEQMPTLSYVIIDGQSNQRMALRYVSASKRLLNRNR